MQELTPTLHCAYRASYGKEGAMPPSLSREKTQYTYRLLILEEGALSVALGDGCHALGAGDMLYLPPGVRYRLSADAPFTLLQIAFDLLGNAPATPSPLCVFASEMCPALCAPLPEGEEYAPLRAGGVWRNTMAGRTFSELLAVGASSPLYPLFAKSALLSAIADILRTMAPRPRRGEEILAYIRSHPEGDMSADALAARFSYHKNYVNALVKEACGLSLSRFVRKVRMRHACSLMAQGGLSPAEVAVRLGYYDYSHFYKAFRAECGTAPTAYLAAPRGEE